MSTTTQAPIAPVETDEDVNLLEYVNRSGDVKLEWRRSAEVEVGEARATFDRLAAAGYLAYKLNKDGTRGEVIRAFDATAKRIVMVPQTVGG